MVLEQESYPKPSSNIVRPRTELKVEKGQVENPPLRKFFEVVAVTDEDKDKIMDEIVLKFNLPRSEILIVDDRIICGIKYRNLHGHPTVWLQKGKFANELPNEETKLLLFTIHSLDELASII